MNNNPFNLKGKKILVTGASSGIGRTTAIECSKMGASVIITGRNHERLNETFNNLNNSEGQEHAQLLCDLTNKEAFLSFIDAIPQINGIVLSSGKGYTAPLHFAKQEKIRDIFETNFFSQLDLIRFLYKKKKLLSGGSIVVIVSIGGTYSFQPGNGIYGATKGALNSIVKFSAIEFANRKIRVNGICPGMIETPLIRGGSITQEEYDAFAQKNPLKRFGNPMEVALGAIYLLSDASTYVTGTNLIIDGGQSLV